MKNLITLLMLLFLVSPAWSAQEWDKSIPCKTGVGTCGSADQRADFPADQQANNAALDRVLANYREGMTLSYSSATTVSVSAGEVVCSTAAGDVRKMRQNPASVNVTFSDIDTGAEEASKQFYLYANCDADATTATFKISASSTAPTGITHFKRLGSFYNDASSNITTSGISNDNNIFSAGFGAIETKTLNTTYQASTDGIVTASTASLGAYANNILGYTDSSSSPTTAVAFANGDSGVYGLSISFPVKKGNYWKVTAATTTTIYWTPIGR